MSMYTPQISAAISDRYLNLIIMPTEKCNFRCTYCYESFKIGKMGPRVIQGVKNLLIARAPNLDFLTISWFGGEPLLALDVIETISTHILTLTGLYLNVHYRADITTNAYFITPEVFQNLLDWNIRGYQISFDGPRAQHDQKRILANGRGTFDRLWQNLKTMKSFNESFAVTVRLHLDRDNFACAPEFLEEFKRDFGDDQRFTLYVRELSQLAEPKEHPLNVFELHEAIPAIESIRMLAEDHGINIRVPERKNHVCHAACYAAKLNSFVIRADGHVSKCTVALDSDVNQVGMINDDGSLTINRAELMKWVRGLASGHTIELGCPMLGIDSERSPVATT